MKLVSAGPVIEPQTRFDRWNAAYNEHERRKGFYNFVRYKYPPDHQFVKEAKAKLDEALTDYKRVLSELWEEEVRGRASVSSAHTVSRNS